MESHLALPLCALDTGSAVFGFADFTLQFEPFFIDVFDALDARAGSFILEITLRKPEGAAQVDPHVLNYGVMLSDGVFGIYGIRHELEVIVETGFG